MRQRYEGVRRDRLTGRPTRSDPRRGRGVSADMSDEPEPSRSGAPGGRRTRQPRERRRRRRQRAEAAKRPKRTGWRRLLPTWRMVLGTVLLLALLARRRLRRSATCSSTSRPPTPPPSPRATSTSTPTAASSPATARSTGRTSPLAQIPKDRPARRTRRRGPRLLHRVRRRPQGDGPRRLEHRHRQGQAVRLHDHPAVREELLPGPGTDRHPQGQGVLHRDQAGPREEQGRDPRGLPQHQLLRPQRLRHPGRRPGLLRQGRRRARPPPRAPTSPPCSTRPASTTSSPTPRTRPRPWPAGTTSSTAWSRRAGSTAAERAAHDVPRRPARPRPPTGLSGPARLPRRGRQGLPHQQQDPRRGRPSPPAATASPPPSTRSQAGRLRQGRRRPADDQARQEDRKVDRYVRAGGASIDPADRQGRRPVRRHRLHQAVRQQRHPPRLPGRLHLQAVRLRLRRRRTTPAPRTARRITPNTVYDGTNKRPVVRAGRRHRLRPRQRGRRRLRRHHRRARPPTSPSTRSTRRWPWTSAPPRSSRPPIDLGIPADTPDLHRLPRPSRSAPPPPASSTWPRPTPPSPTTASTARTRLVDEGHQGRRRPSSCPTREAQQAVSREAADTTTSILQSVVDERHRHRRPGRRPPRRRQDRHRRGGQGGLVRRLHPGPRHRRRRHGPGPGDRRPEVAVRRDWACTAINGGGAPAQIWAAVHRGRPGGQPAGRLRPASSRTAPTDPRPGSHGPVDPTTGGPGRPAPPATPPAAEQTAEPDRAARPRPGPRRHDARPTATPDRAAPTADRRDHRADGTGRPAATDDRRDHGRHRPTAAPTTGGTAPTRRHGPGGTDRQATATGGATTGHRPRRHDGSSTPDGGSTGSRDTATGAGDLGHRASSTDRWPYRYRPGRVLRPLEPVRGHRVQIALAHQHVRDPAHLDLGAVLRVVQHPVARLHRPHVLPDRDHLGPGQPPADRRGRRDQDAAAANAARPPAMSGPDQHTVVQHPDGQLVVRCAGRLAWRSRHEPTCPTRDPYAPGPPRRVSALRRRRAATTARAAPPAPPRRSATGTTRSSRGRALLVHELRLHVRHRPVRPRRTPARPSGRRSTTTLAFASPTIVFGCTRTPISSSVSASSCRRRADVRLDLRRGPGVRRAATRCLRGRLGTSFMDSLSARPPAPRGTPTTLGPYATASTRGDRP